MNLCFHMPKECWIDPTGEISSNDLKIEWYKLGTDLPCSPGKAEFYDDDWA